MSMRDEILQLLDDKNWHCATELIEFGWSARNRISEIRADHGEAYILGETCAMHSHRGGVGMYKVRDEDEKQEVLNRLENAIQIQENHEGSHTK